MKSAKWSSGNSRIRSSWIVRLLPVLLLVALVSPTVAPPKEVHAASTAPPGAVGTVPTPHWAWTSEGAYNAGNWASPDGTYTYRDVAGRLVVVTVQDSALVIDTFDPVSFTQLSTQRVSTANFPYWGGFLAAEDGNLYVALGQDNYEESMTKPVVVVRKYSQSWQLLGEASILGGASQGPDGISTPFDAGQGRMALCGPTLVLHMARLLFRTPDGLRHQANLTISVDTASMTAKSFEDAAIAYSYSSHSFNQFVACRGTDLVVADHGDAYPRAIVAGVMRGFPPAAGSGVMDRRILWELPGTIGDNYTGTTLTGLGLTGDRFLVVGNSVPHSNPVAGLTGSADALPRNVYLISSSLDPGPPTFTWLTALTGQDSSASEPRLVRINDQHFVVLFTITRGQGSRTAQQMEYRLVDATGAVLASRTWQGRAFYPGTDPILLGRMLVWAQRSDSTKFKDHERGYLYALDLANPADPVPPNSATAQASVRVKSVLRGSKLHVDVNPNKGKGYWRFQVQRQQSDGSWKALKTYRTRGKKETRTINLKGGTYRVVVQPKYGYESVTSGTATLRR